MTDVVGVTRPASAMSHERMNAIIAVCVALISVLLAVTNVKSGNVVQAMSKSKADAVSIWGLYQGKRVREFLLAAQIDAAKAQASGGSGLMMTEEGRTLVKSWEEEVARLRADLKGHYDVAKGHEQRNADLAVVDDQFDVAQTFMALSLALFVITALTHMVSMLFMALGVGGLGVFFATAAFAGWTQFMPAWLAQLIGA